VFPISIVQYNAPQKNCERHSEDTSYQHHISCRPFN